MDINSLIMIVLFEFVLIALAPSIIALTDTSTGSALENASAATKVIYALVPLFYAILAIVPIIAVMKFGKK